ncbi:MAG: PIN domain-containing protein [Propionibacteriaceae bacterium]|nr:PIN domain-containing protein [Propionibacteriaceae bacterium]
MPTSSEPLLLDTSAAVALINPAHPHHAAVTAAVAGRRLGLAGHAAFETLSVVTRLPAPNRLSGPDALRVMEHNFPDSRFLEPGQAEALLAEFAARGVVGGSVWDGLVAAAARAHGLKLVTCDRRTQAAYDAIGVDYTMAGAS